MTGPPKPLGPGRVLAVSGGLFLLVVASMVLSITVGAEGIDLLDALRSPGSAAGNILFVVRLPRVILATIVGAALAASGASFQALLRNPLADPYILGVSGGAALGGTVAIAAGIGWDAPGGAALLPLSAFIGAVLSVLLLYSLSRIGRRVSTYTLLLTGVVFNAFAASLITFVKTILAADKAQDLLFWLMGRLVDAKAPMLIALGAYVGVGLLVLLADTGHMNALALGDEGARSLGLDVERVKRRILFSASLVVGAVVSVTGLIGFVGLIVPHIIRLWLGPDHRLLLPASALAGAAFLTLADLLARLLFPLFWSESPVGVITAAVGGPLFLWLLRRRASRGLL
jgi:iron complex transport system permease protein